MGMTNGSEPAIDAAMDTGRDRSKACLERGVLIGTRCSRCQSTTWPGRWACQRCGSLDLAVIDLPTSGRLLTYTIVHIARPNLPVPYLLGQVRLDDGGPVVFGSLRALPSDPRLPLPVHLVVAEDPDALPWYWFEHRG